MIPWDDIYASFAKNFHWTPKQVDTLTLRQIRMLGMDEAERKMIGTIPRVTKQTRTKVKSLYDKAIANLIDGKRWNA